MDSEAWDDGETELEDARCLDEHSPAIDDPADDAYCTACGAAWPCETVTQLEHASESL